MRKTPMHKGLATMPILDYSEPYSPSITIASNLDTDRVHLLPYISQLNSRPVQLQPFSDLRNWAATPSRSHLDLPPFDFLDFDTEPRTPGFYRPCTTS